MCEKWHAGSSLHTNGVPGHLHDLSRYGILLFFMTIVAPWEQANNAAMFAEVSLSLPRSIPVTNVLQNSKQDCLHVLERVSQSGGQAKSRKFVDM